MTAREITTAVVDKTSDMMDQNPNWRYGQAFFNALVEVDKDCAEQVRGSDVDPFHIDDNIPKCIEFIKTIRK